MSIPEDPMDSSPQEGAEKQDTTEIKEGHDNGSEQCRSEAIHLESRYNYRCQADHESIYDKCKDPKCQDGDGKCQKEEHWFYETIDEPQDQGCHEERSRAFCIDTFYNFCGDPESTCSY